MDTLEAKRAGLGRTVVVAGLLLSAAGGVVCYLWTNHAYLKWRFVGGEAGLVYEALSTDEISPDQVVSLLRSGANWDVRISALQAIAMSDRFPSPYEPRTVEAILTFASDMPDGFVNDAWATDAFAEAAAKSGQQEFLPVLIELAESAEPRVRQGVCSAFMEGHGFGANGVQLMATLASDRDATVRQHAAMALGCSGSEAAIPLIEAALSDTDDLVRRRAVSGVRRLHMAGVDVGPLAPPLRGILESSTEPEDNRSTALSILCRVGHMKADDLEAYVDDRHQKVAKHAKHWQTRLQSKN